LHSKYDLGEFANYIIKYVETSLFEWDAKKCKENEGLLKLSKKKADF